MLISHVPRRLGSVSLFIRGKKTKTKDARRKKKILLGPFYRNVGCRSFGVCSQLIC
ncbi:hypothetical protein HU200_065678 [Digitaria exilis]|uniref:Uncharacterized protein n=1 Tax=Digitaria exilis TaxID=1010633 RepID=A0A835DUK3_9POAL|nr:hypothetical protein HU200_065678 [Digitaria exilis]